MLAGLLLVKHSIDSTVEHKS